MKFENCHFWQTIAKLAIQERSARLEMVSQFYKSAYDFFQITNTNKTVFFIVGNLHFFFLIKFFFLAFEMIMYDMNDFYSFFCCLFHVFYPHLVGKVVTAMGHIRMSDGPSTSSSKELPPQSLWCK